MTRGDFFMPVRKSAASRAFASGATSGLSVRCFFSAKSLSGSPSLHTKNTCPDLPAPALRFAFIFLAIVIPQ